MYVQLETERKCGIKYVENPRRDKKEIYEIRPIKDNWKRVSVRTEVGLG